MRERLGREQVIEPLVGQLFLDSVLAQARGEVGEVDAMHCIGELMLPMPAWSGFRYGASVVWRAAFTAAIMRSDPMAMIRSTVLSGLVRRTPVL